MCNKENKELFYDQKISISFLFLCKRQHLNIIENTLVIRADIETKVLRWE